MRRLRFVLLLLMLAVLTSCEAVIDATVTVQEDGSGTVAAAVVIDREAATAILDLESTDGLPLVDVFASGWVVERPELGEDGRTRIEASKRFGTPEQFGEIMDELAGEGVLFEDFELVRETGFAQVDHKLSGTINPAGFASFADPALTELLGTTLQEFALDNGASANDVDIRLTVTLPGDVAPESTNGDRDLEAAAQTRFWTTTLNSSSSTDVSIDASVRETGALVALGIAILTAVGALLALLALGLRVFQADRRRKTVPVNRPSARAPQEPTLMVDPIDPNLEEEDSSGNPKVVALDGMGVLYGSAADVVDVLVPFAHEKGSPLTSDEIAHKARVLSLGSISPTAFWKAVGVEGDAEQLDEEYLSLHSLTPGVVRFLRNLRDRGVRTACITNDSAVWAKKLRQRHSLDSLIDPWVISGAVGARKPDRSIFEVLRRLTGESPASIMIVDDQLEILKIARELGYRTAWFSPDGAAEDADGHPILRSFDVPDAPAPERAPAEA